MISYKLLICFNLVSAFSTLFYRYRLGISSYCCAINYSFTFGEAFLDNTSYFPSQCRLLHFLLNNSDKAPSGIWSGLLIRPLPKHMKLLLLVVTFIVPFNLHNSSCTQPQVGKQIRPPSYGFGYLCKFLCLQ